MHFRYLHKFANQPLRRRSSMNVLAPIRRQSHAHPPTRGPPEVTPPTELPSRAIGFQASYKKRHKDWYLKRRTSFSDIYRGDNASLLKEYLDKRRKSVQKRDFGTFIEKIKRFFNFGKKEEIEKKIRDAEEEKMISFQRRTAPIVRDQLIDTIAKITLTSKPQPEVDEKKSLGKSIKIYVCENVSPMVSETKQPTQTQQDPTKPEVIKILVPNTEEQKQKEEQRNEKQIRILLNEHLDSVETTDEFYEREKEFEFKPDEEETLEEKSIWNASLYPRIDSAYENSIARLLDASARWAELRAANPDAEFSKPRPAGPIAELDQLNREICFAPPTTFEMKLDELRRIEIAVRQLEKHILRIPKMVEQARNEDELREEEERESDLEDVIKKEIMKVIEGKREEKINLVRLKREKIEIEDDQPKIVLGNHKIRTVIPIDMDRDYRTVKPIRIREERKKKTVTKMEINNLLVLSNTNQVQDRPMKSLGEIVFKNPKDEETRYNHRRRFPPYYSPPHPAPTPSSSSSTSSFSYASTYMIKEYKPGFLDIAKELNSIREDEEERPRAIRLDDELKVIDIDRLDGESEEFSDAASLTLKFYDGITLEDCCAPEAPPPAGHSPFPSSSTLARAGGDDKGAELKQPAPPPSGAILSAPDSPVYQVGGSHSLLTQIKSMQDAKLKSTMRESMKFMEQVREQLRWDFGDSYTKEVVQVNPDLRTSTTRILPHDPTTPYTQIYIKLNDFKIRSVQADARKKENQIVRGLLKDQGRRLLSPVMRLCAIQKRNFIVRKSKSDEVTTSRRYSKKGPKKEIKNKEKKIRNKEGKIRTFFRKLFRIKKKAEKIEKLKSKQLEKHKLKVEIKKIVEAKKPEPIPVKLEPKKKIEVKKIELPIKKSQIQIAKEAKQRALKDKELEDRIRESKNPPSLHTIPFKPEIIDTAYLISPFSLKFDRKTNFQRALEKEERIAKDSRRGQEEIGAGLCCLRNKSALDVIAEGETWGFCKKFAILNEQETKTDEPKKKEIKKKRCYQVKCGAKPKTPCKLTKEINQCSSATPTKKRKKTERCPKPTFVEPHCQFDIAKVKGYCAPHDKKSKCFKRAKAKIETPTAKKYVAPKPKILDKSESAAAKKASSTSSPDKPATVKRVQPKLWCPKKREEEKKLRLPRPRSRRAMKDARDKVAEIIDDAIKRQRAAKCGRRPKKTKCEAKRDAERTSDCDRKEAAQRALVAARAKQAEDAQRVKRYLLLRHEDWKPAKVQLDDYLAGKCPKPKMPREERDELDRVRRERRKLGVDGPGKEHVVRPSLGERRRVSPRYAKAAVAAPKSQDAADRRKDKRVGHATRKKGDPNVKSQSNLALFRAVKGGSREANVKFKI